MGSLTHPELKVICNQFFALFPRRQQLNSITVVDKVMAKTNYKTLSNLKLHLKI